MPWIWDNNEEWADIDFPEWNNGASWDNDEDWNLL